MGDGDQLHISYSVQKGEDTLTTCHYDIGIIDAVLASAALPGVEAAVAMGPDKNDCFADGSLLNADPTWLAIKHLGSADNRYVVSLLTTSADDRYTNGSEITDKRTERPIPGFGAMVPLAAVNQALESQWYSVLPAEWPAQSDQANIASVRDFAAGRLFKLRLNPSGVDPLTMIVDPVTKKTALQIAQKQVTRALAGSGLLRSLG
jgi:predicted acylesterase/phospholipase RssA